MKNVAFLRAVNVGGRSIVKMDALRDAFAAAGCANVATFIASGNIIFDGDVKDAALRGRIARRVRNLLAAEPVIVYRTIGQLQRLVAAAPFGALEDDPRVMLYVIFVAEKTKRRLQFPLRLPKEELEAIGARNGDVLIVSRRKPNGMYGFPNNWIEKELGVASTARNWSTVKRIITFAQRD